MNTIFDDDAIAQANRNAERHAQRILDLGLTLFREVDSTQDLDACIGQAKKLWLSLLEDPDVSRFAGQPAHETAAAQILLQHLEDRPS